VKICIKNIFMQIYVKICMPILVLKMHKHEDDDYFHKYKIT
jgi:hypothetical protein